MPPNNNAAENNGFPLTTTLSVIIPVGVALIGGTIIFIQYRRGRGWKCGILPYRRGNDRLRNSDENISNSNNGNAGDGTNNGVNTQNIPIEDIGAGAAAASTSFSDAAAAAASPPPTGNILIDGVPYQRNSNLDSFGFDPYLTSLVAKSKPKNK